MQQYLDLCRRVIETGISIKNERTGVDCITVINADFEYDMSQGLLPVITTRKIAWRLAIAEFLGYLRGYNSAAQFRALNCNTWNANANKNAAWLANKFRTGPDDMGRVYGVQGRSWQKPDGTYVDQLKNIVADLMQGRDNRREILTFWNPGEMDRMCLPACMHTHTFSILDGTLYLTSYQRSDDLPLGHCFNQIQVAWFLAVMAHIAGLKPGIAYHKVVNAHLYTNQVELMKEQLEREPRALPKLIINPKIKSFEDLETWVTPEDFDLEGYDPHPAIKYPFTV